MAETLESIKQEIAKIAAEKADLKGIVDQQKDTIKRQETTIGNLREALKAADANMVDRVNKLQKEIDHYKKYADDEHASNLAMIKENGALTELKEDLKEDLEASKAAHKRTWEEKEALEIKVRELRQDILDMTDKNQASEGMVAALAAKDEELRKLGEKVPAKDREINDLKEQVKSKNKDLEQSYKEFNKLSLEKEHLVNAIENAYRSLMITRGYQLPGESGVSNG